jgi:BASS family bile acid:Na+ symporter
MAVRTYSSYTSSSKKIYSRLIHSTNNQLLSRYQRPLLTLYLLYSLSISLLLFQSHCAYVLHAVDNDLMFYIYDFYEFIYPISLNSIFKAETAAASEEGGAEEKSTGTKIFNAYVKTAGVATTLFPLWTVLFTGAALASPQSFAWFTTEYFTAALAALMLSMGITLTPQDFLDVMKEPASVGMQFTLCYAMMPALALGLGKLFGLDSAMLAGMVLVGSINGGQASNLCTYIARGNVALSVLMTTATTIGAIFMTPLICKGLLGTVVPVDAAGIAFSTIQVVLGPIAVGMATNKFFPGFVKKILPITPVIGVLSTCMLVASAVAQVTEPILNAGLQLQVRVNFLFSLSSSYFTSSYR